MYKNDAQQALKLRQDQKKMSIIRAKQYNDIHELLRPWYSFRLFIKRYDPDIRRWVSKHRYGYEEYVSYNQCWNGHAKDILLNKTKGWKECIDMVERKYVNRDGQRLYKYAQIFQRSTFPGGDFNILCKEYTDEGEVIDHNIPVLDEEDNKTLYFIKANIGLILTEEIMPADADWEAMVTKSLQNE